ncbi:unnamed protein product [Cuscuta europaea]|uniref:SP-RING-type domain-containing protein n=1 Tax=Cuscuta europaea TaxID=41803 RepID=A0A9P0YRT6_CUSEU|nr:unnamed protein product [Cuscuta europaea]
MHWPLHTSLQLNGVPVRVINRPGSQANGRGDGPIITTCIREGINKISMAGIDARVFCFGVRVVKKRTVQQILNCIPKESDGERFEDALARVCRVGGGDVAENADSDSDLQIVDNFISENLWCPMSGSRIKVAGRFHPCTHKGCFDLEVFVEINRMSRKWQCPICLKNYSLEHIIIDPYLNRVTSKLKNCGENVMEIEVKHDGSWRVKAGGDLGSLGDLVQWHLPNGNLCTSSDAESDESNLEILKSRDGCSNGHGNLRVGLKKNPNGVWQISKPEEIIAMSSSSDTVIGKEGCDDVSVNQDNSGVEYEPAQPGNGELIVLSDSDEENELLMIPGNEVPTFSFQQNGIPDSYGNEDCPTFPDSRIGILNTTTTTIASNNEFGIETWPSPHNIQRVVLGFQIFGSNADVQHNLISGCGFPTDMGSVGAVTESSVVYANANINSSLVVGNPF